MTQLETDAAEQQALVRQREQLRLQREAIEGQNRVIEDWFEALCAAADEIYDLDFHGKRKRLDQLNVTVTVNHRHREGPRFTVAIALPIPEAEFTSDPHLYDRTTSTLPPIRRLSPQDQPGPKHPYQPVHNIPTGSCADTVDGSPRRNRTDRPARSRW